MCKRLIALILVTICIMLNVMSVAHAGCHDGANRAHYELSDATELSDHGSSGHQADTACDGCICVHSHHSHVALLSTATADQTLIQKAPYSWRQAADNPYQHYPPARPPKA